MKLTHPKGFFEKGEIPAVKIEFREK